MASLHSSFQLFVHLPVECYGDWKGKASAISFKVPVYVPQPAGLKERCSIPLHPAADTLLPWRSCRYDVGGWIIFAGIVIGMLALAQPPPQPPAN